jgi:hypothetical protein
VKSKAVALLTVLTLCVLFIFQPAGVQAADPEVVATNYSISRSGAIEAYQSFTLTVTLFNNSGHDLDGAVIEVDSGCSFYSAASDGLKESVANWAAGASKPVSFYLTYDGGSRTTLTLKVWEGATSLNVGNNTYTVATTSSSDETEPDDTSSYIPAINIVSCPIVSASAGESLTIALRVKNTSSYTAENIRIVPDLTGDSPFSFNGSSSEFTITDLYPDETRTIRYYLLVSPNAEEKVYTLKFDFTYSNVYGNYFGGGTAPLSQSIYVNVKNTNTLPHLVLETTRVASLDAAHPQVLKTVLKINNAGALAAKDISVTLLGLKDDGLGLYQDGNYKTVDFLAGGSSAEVAYNLIPSAKMGKGNYALTAKIEYKDQSGKAYGGEHQFFVPVQYGGGGATVPRLS